MNLIHFSKERITEIQSAPFSKQKIDFKPFGFWVSDEGNGDGWASWCKAEEFATDCFEFETTVEVDLSKILLIKNFIELDRFHYKYSSPLVPSIDYIDWRIVYKDYSGIIITPYLWERRLDGISSRWYYSWDCASGCIWDRGAIKSFSCKESTIQRLEIKQLEQ